jgi:signal transduction histidine kinase
VADNIAREQEYSIRELAELEQNVDHIKEVVRIQQGLAKVSSPKESINVTELVEDALRMNSSGLARHQIEVIREYHHITNIPVEKHNVLQILINLVRNAKQACDVLPLHVRKLIIRTSCHGDRVHIEVIDNGVGILPENLPRIFDHGFTTKIDGHGFGLRSAATAAKNMGAKLRVHSDGMGRGATFTLELPLEITPG